MLEPCPGPHRGPSQWLRGNKAKDRSSCYQMGQRVCACWHETALELSYCLQHFAVALPLSFSVQQTLQIYLTQGYLQGSQWLTPTPQSWIALNTLSAFDADLASLRESLWVISLQLMSKLNYNRPELHWAPSLPKNSGAHTIYAAKACMLIRLWPYIYIPHSRASTGLTIAYSHSSHCPYHPISH